MPRTTLLEFPQEEQAQMLAALRRARYGYLLALHVLLLCAAGHTPTAIAALFVLLALQCLPHSARLWRVGTSSWTVDLDGTLAAPVRTTVLMPWLRRSLGRLAQGGPACLWLVPQTRWSCATLAARVFAAKHRDRQVSAETVRRWLHELGWVWKRAKLIAKDTDPQRVARLGPSPVSFRALWGARDVMVFADELNIHVLPKVGYAWIPKGARELVMTPGQKRQAVFSRGPESCAQGSWCTV